MTRFAFPNLRLPTGRKKPMAHEHLEQCVLVAFLKGHELLYPELRLVHANFNPGRMSFYMGKKMKREGARPGYPDLFLSLARQGYHGLYIEMKTTTGRLKDSQQVIFPLLKAAGYRLEICRSWQAAVLVIWDYLGLPDAGIREGKV